MCRPFAFALTLLGLFAFAQAQNIVPNYSFETNPGCPTGPCEWQRATSWNNVNYLTGCGSYGTPDYYHTCGAGFSHLPNNGYLTVNPHTGNAVMGFLTWSGSLSPNFRELVSTQLTTPMVVGQNYSVSFWICNGFTPYYGGGSNHIGLDFSSTPLTQPGTLSNVVSLVPEYEIPGVFFSNGWVNYTFNITPTQPYQYITFGNFYNDAATTATLFYAAAPYFRCYYFIDDVVIQTAVVLPLQLDRPVVSLTDHGSSVAWSASEEQGIVRYEVERSRFADKDFETVGQTMIVGQGNYALEDRSLTAPGTYYYRIHAVDANGQSVWSETATFDFAPNYPLLGSVYPNPVRGQQAPRVRVWLPQGGAVELAVYDLQGRKLDGIGATGVAGQNEWEVPASRLAAGVYLLRLHSVDGVASLRFVVE